MATSYDNDDYAFEDDDDYDDDADDEDEDIPWQTREI